MMRYSPIFALLLLLPACQADQSATAIAATGVALAAAQTVALKYATLPVCPPGATQEPDKTVCQQATITTNMKGASAAATSAYQAAASNPTSATAAAAAAALAGLTTLTGSVAVPAN
jgi:hypothetical protein